jgi:hypothetical protein
MRSRLTSDAEDVGRLLAGLLAGAWRPSPSPGALSLSDLQLQRAVPRLLETGAASLGWWRVRRSPWRQSSAAVKLLQAFRLHALQVGLHEDALQALVPFLRSAGIEPVLGKGWRRRGTDTPTGTSPLLNLKTPAQRGRTNPSTLMASRLQTTTGRAKYSSAQKNC